MLPKQTDYKVGIYLRLSRDDERQGESLSIENQRRVLTNYVNEQGWTLYDEYVDDGISGTSFDRPGVQRMLDDAKAGKINLILCKDLSRFGRNYIQVGQYTDYIFPMYNIRFIALADNVDTANSASSGMDMMPIMNVFNEWHCANTSKKIRAVLETNAKSGKYMSPVSAYGYLKGDDEKCTPVIDPEAAPVVLRMFQMRAKGYSCKKIAEVLNNEHILIPSDLIYKRLGKPNPRRTEHLWSDNVVRRILANRIYIGDLAQCKSTSVSYKNHKKIYHDEADWIIIENNHEPIVPRELWDKVREYEESQRRGKRTKAGVTQPLSGLCYCSTCGSKMKQQGSDGYKRRPFGYTCRTYANFGKKYCSSHYILGRSIKKIVLADIRQRIDFVMNDAQARGKYLAGKRSYNDAQSSNDKAKLQEIEKRTAELDRLIQTVFEDKVAGKIPENMAFSLLNKYQAERNSLQEELSAIHERVNLSKLDEDDVDEYIRRLKSYAGADDLTREMALDLIEYVIIDENPRDIHAPRDIHIYYKLLDKPLKDKNNALV